MKGNKELTSQAVISNVLLTEQKLEQNEVVRQNFYNAYKECNPYNPAVTYVPNNKVIYMGGTYQNILTCTNITPTYNLNNDNWICIASSGTGGDMYKTVYDTHNKQADIFDYVDNKANTKLDIGKDYSPNILFNGDFKLWSAKTSFAFYNAAGGAGGYTADKWYIYVGTGTTATVSKVNNGLQVVTNGATQILQFLNDDEEYLNKLVGKTVTISYKLDGMVQSHTQTFQKDPTDNRIIVITFNTGTHIFEWIKLEINDHATPFIPKSYKEELLNCSDNLGYAPNLLINGDFKVWQRGETFDRTSIAGRFYTADRWTAFRGGYNAGANVVKDGKYIKVTNPNDGNYTALGYSFEEKDITSIAGKILTLSCKIKAASNLTMRIALWYSPNGITIPGNGGFINVATKDVDLSSNWTLYQITGILPSDAKGLYVELAMEKAGQYWFEYAKLEVNDHATPIIPRSYAEELAMCQRYYERSAHINNLVGSKICIGVNPTLLSGFDFAVEKRVAPTITLYSRNGTANKVSIVDTGADVGTTVIATPVSTKTIRTIEDSGNGFSKGSGYEVNYTADAEI